VGLRCKPCFTGLDKSQARKTGHRQGEARGLAQAIRREEDDEIQQSSDFYEQFS